MKLVVISDCRLPTKPDGGHGLGMSASDIARGLSERGHEVVMLAGPGSIFPHGELIIYNHEARTADVVETIESVDAVLDTSHSHAYHKMSPRYPFINRHADREGRRTTNAVVNSPYMQTWYRSAVLVNTGIDITNIPFYDKHDTPPYAVFASAPHRYKGIETASEACQQAGVDLIYLQSKTGPEKWDVIGRAGWLLHPSILDAAPRLPLEAAACGTPTLCLDDDGTKHHVNHGHSGWVCRNVDDIVLWLRKEPEFNRQASRRWVEKEHGFERMVLEYEKLLVKACEGHIW